MENREKQYAVEACRKAQQEKQKMMTTLPYFVDKAMGLAYYEYFRTETVDEEQVRLEMPIIGYKFCDTS